MFSDAFCYCGYSVFLRLVVRCLFIRLLCHVVYYLGLFSCVTFNDTLLLSLPVVVFNLFCLFAFCSLGFTTYVFLFSLRFGCLCFACLLSFVLLCLLGLVFIARSKMLKKKEMSKK